jgi:hypothetical protein
MQDTATWADVMRCIRADDLWHASFNEVCADGGCHAPLTRLAPYVRGRTAQPQPQVQPQTQRVRSTED